MRVSAPAATPVDSRLVKAPVLLVALAGAALAISAMLLVFQGVWFSVAGYLLAPLVVTVLVSLYRFKDIHASQSVWYASSPKQRKISSILIVVSFVVGLGHAWVIATEVAKAFAS